MVTMMMSDPSQSSGGLGVLLLIGAVVGVGYLVQVQLNPFTRCSTCSGGSPNDGKGNYHRCRTCKGAAERLRFAAWAMLKLGVPVPRARHGAKRNRWGIPDKD